MVDWSESEIVILKENYASKNREELEKLLPQHTYHSIRDEASELGIHKQAIIVDRKELAKDKKNLWEFLKQAKAEFEKDNLEQGEITIKFPVDEGYWGLIPIGDLHIGSNGVDYEQLQYDIKEISKADGVSVLLNGDIIDNMTTNASPTGASFEELITPKLQKQIAEDIIESLFGKIVAVIQGQHDNWSYLCDNFLVGEYLAKLAKSAYMGFGGFLNIQFGSVRYRMFARHSYRFESELNPSNSLRRAHQILGSYDLGVLGDKHIYNTELTNIANQRVVMIRTGTYKQYDEYARRLGFGAGQYGVPLVIFCRDVKRLIVFDNFYEGLRYLDFLRGLVPREDRREQGGLE
jgi:hypothetical protein